MRRLFNPLLFVTFASIVIGCGGDGTASSVAVDAVIVVAQPETVFVAGSVLLAATVKDAGGNVLTGRTVTWSTSSSAVATVTSAGLVRGVAPGTATITATCEGKTGSVAITVQAPPGPPPAPVGVTASSGPTAGDITVSWGVTPSASTYSLYWGTSPGITPQSGTAITNVLPGFHHSGLTPNTTYYYIVTASNGAGVSPPSAEAHATASLDISLRVVEPILGDLIGNRLGIVVVVTSRLQLTSVVGRVSGRSANLLFVADTTVATYHGSAWAATLDLSGLPHGITILALSATDVSADSAQAAVAFRYDVPPSLVISAPSDFVVARPNVHVTVSCQDDIPSGCQSLFVQAQPSGTTVAQGTTTIDQTISLAAFEGQPVDLLFTGIDSAGQVTSVFRRVFVESSPQLTPVDSVNGLILDVQPDRILFLDQSGSGSVLAIHDRASGTNSIIYTTAGKQAISGYLTAPGALFVVDTLFGSGPLFAWENGGLIGLGPISTTSLIVKDGFAIWNRHDNVCCLTTLIRRDLNTGQNTSITGVAGDGFNDVATNGDVVYWTNSPPLYQIVRFRNGASTPLTSDTLGSLFPVTDGVSVVYRKVASIGQEQVAVYDSAGEHLLTPFDGILRTSGSDYQVNNGWVAYTKAGPAGRVIWSRSPAGVETQVTSFGTPSTIDALDPNGAIALRNAFGIAHRRYLAQPDYSAQPRDIGSSLGKAYFLGGGLYVAIGRMLFRVN